MESYDAELTFLGVRMPMCPMCEHVAHDTHQAREQKKNRKKSIFSKFLRIRKFSENFSQIFFCQKVAENHLISLTCSFEQNRSIRSDLRAFWKFSIFWKFFKKSWFFDFWRKKIIFTENALKSLPALIFCWNRRTELQIGIRTV